MHGYVNRILESEISSALRRSPAVAILGPRQCGKSTTARKILEKVPSVYLDLQDRTDRNKLNEPELFFDRHRHELICLDEIQQIPEFFSVLRSEIDRDRRAGRFLILGSASRDLLRQSTESLAGRLAFIDLTPFMYPEIRSIVSLDDLWLRGGFPESVLAENDTYSFDWRLDFIRTYMERDIPSLGFAIPVPVIERLWRLLAHYHGQIINFSKFAQAADISIPTLKKYLALLEQTYMVRILPATAVNLKKRLVKSPKIYIRDSGILHALLDIEDYDQLLAHPSGGASWEGMVLENMITMNKRWTCSYIRTSNGAEADLVMERAGRRYLIECKLSKAPRPSRGFHELMETLKPDSSWIVAPVEERYEFKKDIWICPLDQASLVEKQEAGFQS